jgi:CubicO group peptidase (beta-lactamase class C family)
MMIRDRGEFNGQQVLPASWVDASLQLDDKLIGNMRRNAKYAADPWQAYHNMWWLLDAAKGEYAAVGIHGQVIYINRSADMVAAWFSSQPVASAAGNKDFHSKLDAIRLLAHSQ